jgi:DNA-binding CsgD family transcriptional regulator
VCKGLLGVGVVTECSGRGRSGWFVSRSRELDELAGALAVPGSVVLVEGEAGIGKTRLVSQCLAVAAGRWGEVLVTWCPPFRRPHTLGPVTDALRHASGGVAGLGLSGLAGALRPLFPEWANDLPPALEPAEDATAVRHRLFRALAELIGCLQIAVLVVEDVHWADEATLEFLLYLTSGPGPAPRPALVVTYRPEDVSAGSLLPQLSRPAARSRPLRLALGPLDVADTGDMVSSMLAGERVSAEFAAFVHGCTEGVPLAVEELVRLMADRADLGRGREGWIRRSLAEIAVPPTVRDAVLERAGRLTAHANAVLAAVAGLSEPADEALVGQVSGLAFGQVRAGLTEALRARLLVEDSRGFVSFRHVLAAQAVYEAIPGPHRRELHRRAGQALQVWIPLPVARLAWHFREAGDITQWMHYAEQAADQALASGDEATGALLVRDLIREVRPLSWHQAAELLQKTSYASIRSLDYEHDVERSVQELLDVGTGDRADEAELRLQLARILHAKHAHRAARRQLELAIPFLTDKPAQAARAMSLLGVPHDMTTARSEHLRWLRHSARAMATLEGADLLLLLVSRATALLLLGEEEGWAVAAEITGKAATIADTRHIVAGLTNSGDLAMAWGRYEDAGQRLRRALELAETHEYRRYREVILGTQAHLDWFTGAWAGLAERTGDWAAHEEVEPGCRLESMLISGLLHAATGSADRAEDCFRRVLAQRRELGAPYFIMEPAAALARLMLTDGRVADAVAVTEEPIKVLAVKGAWFWGADLAPTRLEALVAAGRVADAADLAAAFAAGVRGQDAPVAQAALSECRGLMARARGAQTRAASLFAQAAKEWQELPRPYAALLARERWAGCLMAAGDREGAMTLRDEMLAGFSGLGATADASRVARQLGALRPATRNGQERKGRRGYGDQLSPREMEVSRLLLTGMTNRDIAGRLFLSPKTVARHLGSAMRKLDVNSRTALAVRLVESGLLSGHHPVQPGSHSGS